ncbi:transposase [Paenibacillus elgii]|uniref:transposase n=1 Tax=Paenibacillus elgii TaxID=189691 RepID=UPI001F2574DD|nr:transposase [Paenibacillus elgii]
MYLWQSIERVEAETRRRLEDKRNAIELLTSILGINEQAGMIILAEIGLDISKFKRDGHLAAWAGMCPGNHESACKKTNASPVWQQQLKVDLMRMCLGRFYDAKHPTFHPVLVMGKTNGQEVPTI